MTIKRKLNLDIAEKISEFEELIKETKLRKIPYKILFRGRGLEFDSYRDYAPDDDAINIDWKASKRTNKLLVKQYIEERDLNIMIVIDISDNMIFGSTEKIKCEYSAELSATLAHLIINSRDKLGYVFFNEKITNILLPSGGENTFEMFVEDISNPLNYGGVSNPQNVINLLLESLPENIDAVIIISDFIKLQKSSLKVLNLFSSRFETIAIVVKDLLDNKLPKISREIIIEDPTTKQRMVVDPAIARKLYEKNAREHDEMLRHLFENAGIDSLELTTDKSFILPLVEFLQGRVEERRYILPK